MLTSVLLSVATLLQPLVGLQLFLIFGFALCYSQVTQKQYSYKPLFHFSTYLLFTGWWIVLLFHQQGGGDLGNAQFLAILESRLGHHFFPEYFSHRDMILSLPLFLLGFFWGIKNRLYPLLLAIIFGIVVYLFNWISLDASILFKTQWFKTTIWLEGISLLIILGHLEKILSRVNLSRLTYSVFILCFIALIVKVRNVRYGFPGVPDRSEEMTLAKDLSTIHLPDAQLLIPPDFTLIRHVGKKSLFVDYKSNVHSEQYLRQVAERRFLVYGLDLEQRRKNDHLMDYMMTHYKNLNKEKLMELKNRGATHILTSTSYPGLLSTWSSENYHLYEL